jgi:hypothetical protein
VECALAGFQLINVLDGNHQQFAHLGLHLLLSSVCKAHGISVLHGCNPMRTLSAHPYPSCSAPSCGVGEGCGSGRPRHRTTGQMRVNPEDAWVSLEDVTCHVVNEISTRTRISPFFPL